MQKTTRSWSITVTALPAAPATPCSSERPNLPAHNSSPPCTSRRFARRVATSTRNSYQLTASTLKFTRLEKNTRMLKPEDAPPSMEKCRETRPLARRSAILSTSIMQRKKWHARFVVSLSRTYADLTCLDVAAKHTYVTSMVSRLSRHRISIMRIAPCNFVELSSKS